VDKNSNIIKHVCRIDNHPIKELPKPIQQRYLKGLGAVLYVISDGSETMKTLFSQWAYSITGEYHNSSFAQETDKCIKQALSLNRIGFRFFRCKHEFFFDSYYLVESFDKKLLPKLDDYFNLVAKTIFTKESIKNTSAYFNSNTNNTTLRIPEYLISHRTNNLGFRNKYSTRVLVVANISAGKSTLINALLGHQFNKVKSTACTSRLCAIHNKPVEDGFVSIKSNILLYDQNIDVHTSDESTNVAMHFKSTLGSKNICLIDTPGVNNSVDSEHWKITTDEIKKGEYDIIIFISNGKYNGTVDERTIIEYIYKNNKKPVLFVLNQLDNFKSSVDSISEMIQDYMKELKTIGFKQPNIYPISAMYAYLLRNTDKLDDEELDELERMKKRFTKAFYDLQKYTGESSKTDIERSGIISLEKGIINHIK